MWKVIKGLNGTPEVNSPNEAMSQHDRVISDAKAKANIFVNHHARVSNLPMSVADRQLNRTQETSRCTINQRQKLLEIHDERAYISHQHNEM